DAICDRSRRQYWPSGDGCAPALGRVAGANRPGPTVPIPFERSPTRVRIPPGRGLVGHQESSPSAGHFPPEADIRLARGVKRCPLQRNTVRYKPLGVSPCLQHLVGDRVVRVLLVHRCPICTSFRCIEISPVVSPVALRDSTIPSMPYSHRLAIWSSKLESPS